VIFELAIPLANHLWQSTLFAVVPAVLSLLLKKNRAAVRYALWFAVSMKFLIPFSLLTGLASQLELRSGQVTSNAAVVSLADGVNRPFQSSEPEPETIAPETDTAGALLPAAGLAVWLCGTFVVAARWFAEWRRLRRIRRTAATIDLGQPLPTLVTDAAVEPGVFGITRPVLLLPQDLQQQLGAEQLRAVLAHELCHVRRHDNLTAAIHMGVQALFWFHPLVWWVGRRLVEERERACDEAVLRGGREPVAYAEGILKVCRFYRENRPACTSGVTGADLKKRIEVIMKNDQPKSMGWTKRIAVAVSFVLAVGVPVMLDVLVVAGQQRLPMSIQGPAFEVASVKLTDPNDRLRTADTSLPSGRYYAKNQNLRWLIEVAYSPMPLPNAIHLDRERIVGGPDWIHNDRFTIEASAGRSATGSEMSRMLRRLLADRFNLRVHVESRQQAVYELAPLNSNKPQLRLVESKECEKSPRQGMGGGPGRMQLRCVPMALLADALAEITGRPVFDNTGMTGTYDGLLEYIPTDEEIAVIFGGQQPPAESLPAGPSIFTALQEQFGLRLVSQRRPVEYLVIDSVERPSEN
jgi:uncharacterized protein (TIGR03435 family)